MTIKTSLFLLFAATALAQTGAPPNCQQINCYVASTGNVTLNPGATAATIQQPSSGPYQTMFGIKASVYCSVACVVTRKYGGTAASATAGTVTQMPYQPFGPVTATLLFFTASNAGGSPTTIDVTNLGAGTTWLYDLSDVVFGSVASQMYTISIGSITGTANITFYVGLR